MLLFCTTSSKTGLKLKQFHFSSPVLICCELYIKGNRDLSELNMPGSKVISNVSNNFYVFEVYYPDTGHHHGLTGMGLCHYDASRVVGNQPTPPNTLQINGQ